MAALSGTSNSERCSWCGAGVEPGDGFRAGEHPGERMAVFCRLEHVVPWAIQGAHWEPGTPAEPAAVTARHDECAQCGVALDDVHVQLVRHRGEPRVAGTFCGAEHMAD